MKKVVILLTLALVFGLGVSALAADVEVGGEARLIAGRLSTDYDDVSAFQERLRLQFSTDVNEYISMSARLVHQYVWTAYDYDGYSEYSGGESLEFDRANVSIHQLLPGTITVGRQAVGSGGPFKEIGLMGDAVGDGISFTSDVMGDLTVSGYLFPKAYDGWYDEALTIVGGKAEFRNDFVTAALNVEHTEEYDDNAFTVEALVPLAGDKIGIYAEIGKYYGSDVTRVGAKFSPAEDLTGYFEYDTESDEGLVEVVKKWHEAEFFGMYEFWNDDYDGDVHAIDVGMKIPF